jgi:hypothetical protein
MDMVDATSQLLAMRLAGTQQTAQFAILKKSHEMEMALLDSLAEIARSAPAPEGQGLLVDKRA